MDKLQSPHYRMWKQNYYLKPRCLSACFDLLQRHGSCSSFSPRQSLCFWKALPYCIFIFFLPSTKLQVSWVNNLRHQTLKLLTTASLLSYNKQSCSPGLLLRWLNLNMNLNTLTVSQTVLMQTCTQAQALDKLQSIKTGRNLHPVPS